mgnify:CR=1 FL=1
MQIISAIQVRLIWWKTHKFTIQVCVSETVVFLMDLYAIIRYKLEV